MKTVLNKFLAIMAIAALGLASCKKDGALVSIASNGGTAGALTATSSTLVLVKANAADTTTKVITFKVTNASYGFTAAVTSTLQIDVPGDNWVNPQPVTLAPNVFSKGFSTIDFNNTLLKLNLPTGKASTVSARIVYTVSGSIKPLYSNVLTLTVTPFALITYVYVPGMEQNTDPNLQWHPETADSLVSATGNGVYVGYLHFTAGDQFKITPAKGWATSYGDAGGGKINLTGGNITAPGTGLYFVTFDSNAGSITYSKYDHLWSITGDGSTGWGNDVDMPFVINSNAYQVTAPLLKAGQIKFRADHDWALSMGDVTPVTGQLTSNNGGNISIPANGTYLVTLSFGNPLLGPTYTLVKQ